MPDDSGTTRNASTKRKYQVFISSTFIDLRDQRRMVVDVVVDRGHMPIALERFPAADRGVPDVIQRTIDASQIYVLILGHRYGALVPGRDISFSQLEFESAVKQNKVVLPFLLSDEEVKTKRKELEARLDGLRVEASKLAQGTQEKRNLDDEIGNTESELASEDNLWRFRRIAQKGRFSQLFSLPGPEATSGTQHPPFDKHMALMALLDAEEDAVRRRVRGWIREPENAELADTVEAVSKNHFLRLVVESLAKFNPLGHRIGDQAEQKRAAARIFRDKHLQGILNDEVNLFFESGSSIAYVANVVGKNLLDDSKTLRISTNNVLAYLIFWLIHRIQCSLFPWGRPERRYGAVFGEIDRFVREEKQPCFPPEPLSVDDHRAIEALRNDPYSPAGWTGLTLMLGALSGFQTEPDPEIKNCLGPHVGSPRNKIFKRFMYSTKKPLMLFLTTKKIDGPVNRERCHFILEQEDGQELTWEMFRRDWPVCFCVGCGNEPDELNGVVAKFEQLQFDVVKARYGTEHTAFIARNQKFIDEFESKIWPQIDDG